MAEIPCLPLRQVTDGPLFSAGPGTLSALTNMELRPGGYAEARGGFEELKPSGGTAADALSAGGHSDAIQMSTNYGWIMEAYGGGTVYAKNWALGQGQLTPFSTGTVEDAWYFGADATFSRVGFYLYTAASWTVTISYEYWNGSTWAALTTSETPTWTATPDSWQYLAWTMPSNWATTTRGDATIGYITAYWIRMRMSAKTAIVTLPVAITAFGSWVGTRQLYAATQNPFGAANNGALKRYGQNGTAGSWLAISSTLFSSNTSVARLSSYRGRVIIINGKEQKRWDGFGLEDLGLSPPGTGTTATVVAGAGLGAGIWRYYIAFGYGPPQRILSPTTHQWDWDPLYGASKATYIAEKTTTAGNEWVTIDWSALSLPTSASTIHIYRTDDLTNVPAGKRPFFPAFLIDTYARAEFTKFTTFTDGATFTEKMNPPVEADLAGSTPPERCKFLFVYQNRLFLGDDNFWWWSEPFKPDRFNKSVNYIALARSEGGRHMGGVEFGDQGVLFTEDQTWGVANVDMDVPQLFPIALGIGCVAPDAIAVVDGILIWPARDGFYAWDGGKGPPVKISGKMKETFGKMNFETHGGSTATGHNRRYDVRFASQDKATVGSAYRYNLDSGEWCTLSPTGFSSTLFPLTTIYAPLGNSDAGAVHPLWGKCDYGTGAGEYTLFIGEQTTQDNGSNYTCSGTMHFPLKPGELLTPQRVIAYYQATDGWGTPSFTFASSDVIGSAVGTLNTGTADTGSDYSVIGATFSAAARGSSDLKVTFSVNSAASGTVNNQRLYGAYLQGNLHRIRRGGV